MESSSLEKEAIRRRIWSLMEERGIATFPKPAFGRIPNFVGAVKASLDLVEQGEFKKAEVVKVNPDAPQHRIRSMVLSDGKMLLMPSPRLRKGFLILDSSKIPRRFHAEASTIRGSFKYGRPCPLEKMPHVDLIVAGSVAVTEDGIRVGKGGGYSEIEYGVLREIGAAEEKTPIFTTVHDVQIIDWAPREPHDFTVDGIVTPTRKLKVRRKHERPKGIFWERISQQQLQDIPILSELRKAKNIRS